jgi:zinc protease
MRILSWVTALCVLCVALSAQVKPLTYEEYVLPNGLRVILHEDHSAPVAATVLHYGVGSRDEDPARTGFAHFFEHLMFEATDAIERAQIDKLINGAGGELNAFTSQDQTVYHFVVPSNQVRLALWIEAQRMRKLHVNSIGVETQRGVVKEERKNRYDNAPYGGMLDKMMAKLFVGTPYAWSTIGSAQHIDSASISEFKEFYNEFYQPNNCVLVVSGDINPNEIKESIQVYFGGYPKAPEPRRPVFAGAKPMVGESREVIADPRAQLPALFIGYQSPGMKDNDAYATELLGTIMSTGESSRLYRSLVDSQQVAVQVSVQYIPREFSGLSLVVAIAAPGKELTAVEHALDVELQKVATSGVTASELTKAKNIAEAEFVSSRAGAYQKALNFSNYQRFFGNTALINNELEKYMSVTAADIQRVALKLFGAKNRVVLQYNPTKG